MEDSVFTKIIKGEIPSHKIYEDEQTFAFLDVHPAAEGHALIVPKVQVEYVWDLGVEEYTALMQTVKKVADRLREIYPDKYVSEMIVGVDVPHAHVHLVPFMQADELKLAFDRPMNEPYHEALTEVAKRLRFS